MADTPEDLQRRIDAIEAQRSVIGDAAADAALAVLKAQLTASVYGHANAGTNSGQNTGVNNGVIQQFLYATPATPAAPAPPPPAPAPPRTLAEQLEALVEQLRQQQRDALTAALRYQELGGRAGLARRMQPGQIAQVEDELRKGLADLLTYPALSFSLDQRIQAGRLLGILGDPRFPTTPVQWRDELAQCNATFGQPNGYFCYVPAGTYAVGGWGKDMRGQPAVQHALPSYWIARYPITNQQRQAWVDAGGTPSSPSYSVEHASDSNAPNQPALVNISDAMMYAGWLTKQLKRVGALPAEYEIRLPTEAEWEVAAAYDGQGTRRTYPWGDAPEPDADHAIFKDAQGNTLGATAPVGVCAAGAAACGAADMAGNVWEWCASSGRGYPQAAATYSVSSKAIVVDGRWFRFDTTPVRGVSLWDNISYIPCKARSYVDEESLHVILHGLRVVCAPCLR